MKLPALRLLPILFCVGILFAAVCATANPPGSAAIWTNSLDMKFIQIPAGTFIEGSPLSEPGRYTNETLHPVSISKSFWLGATHVTVGQFSAFVKQTGYKTAAEKEGWAYGAWNARENKWNKIDGGCWKNPGFRQSDDCPVVCVDWHDAVAFCEWLSAKEKRTYRLPSEAEWEYACRAGKSTVFPWGNDPAAGKGCANCADATATNIFNLFPPFPWSDGYLFTSPVATFRPNDWGLFDMIGNALEWCGDWFADYPTNAVTDPIGPSQGTERVLRGGAFVYGPERCRCAFRGRNSPGFRNFYIGFRVVLTEPHLNN